MAKFQSPLLGYNNNVRHKGRIFHIQTEDSGVNHPHIITHLFMDGGRILKSVKKSYAEHVGTDTMSETVRVMMKEQHKAMFIALRDGQFDSLVDGGPAKAGSAPTKAPDVKPKPPPPPEEDRSVVMLPETTSDDSLGAVKVPPAASSKIVAAKAVEVEEEAPNTVNESVRLEAVAKAVAPAPAAAKPDEAEEKAVDSEDSPSEEPIVSIGSEETIDVPAESDPSLVAAAPVAPIIPPPAPARVSAPIIPPAAAAAKPPEHRRPSAAELTLDFDALERDTGVTPSPMFKNSDLPPPPAALFAKHEAQTYRATEASSRQETISTRPGKPSKPPPAPSRGSDSRYAPARPAAIFGASAKPSPSIFSDDLVSDKSLDEVILSYLAEDLDPPRRK